jgi:DNA-binding transcriptional LysR family regulator
MMEWDAPRIGRYLKLRDLNVLLTVARYGSMGKAAAQLSVSQPAISKAIADMEQALGTRLLDRTPRGVEPTIYARALLDRSTVAFDELRQAVRQIEHLADPTVGEVRLGCSVILAEGFVTAVINRLSQRYPRMSFQLSADESGAIYRALEERRLDLAVARIFELNAAPHLVTEILYDEPHIVAAGAHNALTRRRGIRLADLMDQPWALPPLDSLTGSIVQQAFAAVGLAVPEAAVVTSSTPARHALVASGRCLSILPASVLARGSDKPGVKALPIDLAQSGRPIGIITLQGRTISPAAQSFIDCARVMAQQWHDNAVGGNKERRRPAGMPAGGRRSLG